MNLNPSQKEPENPIIWFLAELEITSPKNLILINILSILIGIGFVCSDMNFITFVQ